MKRSANLSWLVERSNQWLSWWQELILNWVASWATVGQLVVIAANGEDSCEWSLPSDLDLQRMELEEMLER